MLGAVLGGKYGNMGGALLLMVVAVDGESGGGTEQTGGGIEKTGSGVVETENEAAETGEDPTKDKEAELFMGAADGTHLENVSGSENCTEEEENVEENDPEESRETGGVVVVITVPAAVGGGVPGGVVSIPLSSIILL